MKLLLDTTLLLPAIGISVKGLQKDAPIQLKQKGQQLHISGISIFELSAKGAKHITTGALPPERVMRGIRAIIYNDTVEKIPSHDDKILLTAFKLRRLLGDFIDCLILSSAMSRCNILITEDSDIQELKKSREFNELLANTNPKFKIQASTEILQSQ